MNKETEKGFYHVLNQGEDIWLLAELYYGDASLWWIIYHANLQVYGDDPEYTRPGIEVFVPYLEVNENKGEIPDFLALVAAEPSYDPMILLAKDYYSDPVLVFDLYEYNGWEPHRVPTVKEPIRYFFRASKPAMKRAERWRAIFYRG